LERPKWTSFSRFVTDGNKVQKSCDPRCNGAGLVQTTRYTPQWNQNSASIIKDTMDFTEEFVCNQGPLQKNFRGGGNGKNKTEK